MEFTEKARTNEVGAELQRDETSTFDDIYVPGLGVRGALGGDEPESSQFWSWVGDGCTRGAALVSRATRWTLENICHAGSRVPVALTNVRGEIRTTIACWLRLLLDLTKSVGRGLRETERHLAASIQSAAGQLRSVTKNRLSFSARIVTRGLERSALLRATRIARSQIRRASKYRLSLPPIPVTVLRTSHRAQSVLRSAVAGRNRLRVAGDYRPHLRIPANYKPELTNLRRAAPALVIMLAMIVFVIQEVVVIVKR